MTTVKLTAAAVAATSSGARTEYRIYPSIGIARVGDSKDGFFIGPEAPGVAPEGPFRGKDDGIKPQGARFRVFQVDIDVAGLGVIRACHGSPRADVEIITPGTPIQRLAAATTGIDADVLLTGHSHLQFHRRVVGLRIGHSVNPGSVGIPYGVAWCWSRNIWSGAVIAAMRFRKRAG